MAYKEIDMKMLEMAADVLKVLAHPHRLKIVELLMHGRLSVGEIAARITLAPNAVSQHLNQMKAHGILDVQREGRTAYYFVINPNAENVIKCITEHGCGK
ncbi:ArsR/SmtB family transcription factor [Poriferisphaera sp. WC338]|uniref:ArsR/SmtB family transcription factor n=1 Tax=Poriferisphaera sp. WC338 TaxID=3425129 RepID=UPI003D813501